MLNAQDDALTGLHVGEGKIAHSRSLSRGWELVGGVYSEGEAGLCGV